MITTKFFFYSKSADARPGKGSGETLSKDDEILGSYSELEKVKNWRKMLSNFYVSPFVLDGNVWNSVEQFFHAVKFRNGKRDSPEYSFYKTFTIGGGRPWSLDPLNAKQAGKAGRVSDRTGSSYAKKVYDKKICGFQLPLDVRMREDFYSGVKDKMETMAAFAKFTQNPELKRVLLLTGDAELWHIVGRGAPSQKWVHLMRVRSCIREYDGVYDLGEVSKLSSDKVSEILD